MRRLKKILVVFFIVILGYIAGAIIGTLVDIFVVTGPMATTAYGGIEFIGVIAGAIIGIRRVRRWPEPKHASPMLSASPPQSSAVVDSQRSESILPPDA
jgi:hypothetical protein